MRTVMLTGSELRHRFMRTAIASAPDIVMARSYCESSDQSATALVRAQEVSDDIRLNHLAAREASEQDFFAPFLALATDTSQPQAIPKGAINDAARVEEIAALRPDVIAAYGCSIIRDPLLGTWSGRFLNVHLGLSPYYRGAGTNYWPLVAGAPEYVGATFMHIDAGIDTGDIIHQIRARVHPGDRPHDIGNRLIADVALVYADVIRKFDRLAPMPQPPIPDQVLVYRKKDFTIESTHALYASFGAGMIDRYLAEQATREAAVPLVAHPDVASVADLLGIDR